MNILQKTVCVLKDQNVSCNDIIVCLCVCWQYLYQLCLRFEEINLKVKQYFTHQGSLENEHIF